MAATYPGAITPLPQPASRLTGPTSHSDHDKRISDELHATQVELGADPSGTYPDVAARLAALISLVDPTLLTALNTRYAPFGATPPASDLTIILGDSVAAASDDATAQGGSWFSYLCKASGGRIQYLRNAGIGGQNTSQMLARVATDVIAYNPGWCILGVSVNDQSQIGNLATSKANIVATIAALKAAGIRPIVFMAVPNNTPAVNTYVTTMNAWMGAYAYAHGIPLFDLHTPLTDPLTGMYVAAYTADGIHPNMLGQQIAADYNLARIPAAFGRGPQMTTGIGDAGNMVAGGCFMVDTNGDGIADGWVKAGTPGLALVPMSAAEGYGNWQQVTCVGGALGYIFSPSITTGFAAGDVLEFTGRFQSDTAVTGLAQLMVTPGTFLARPVAWSRNIPGTYTWHQRLTIPVGTTEIWVQLSVNTTAGAFRWGQVCVRNLTALGAI